MITVVFPVSTEVGFKNLKQSLSNILPDVKEEIEVLCPTDNSDLYMEIRNYFDAIAISSDRKLVSYCDGDLLNHAKSLMSGQSRYTVLVNENIRVEIGAVSRLLRDYLDNKFAGLISGDFKEFPIPLWVDNIYAEFPKSILSDERDLTEDLVEIDMVMPYLILTKTSNFMTYNFSHGKQNYGLFLRRGGYSNYLDRKVALRYG